MAVVEGWTAWADAIDAGQYGQAGYAGVGAAISTAALVGEVGGATQAVSSVVRSSGVTQIGMCSAPEGRWVCMSLDERSPHARNALTCDLGLLLSVPFRPGSVRDASVTQPVGIRLLGCRVGLWFESLLRHEP